MFKKIFDNFDDLDMEKLLEVVNLVWNNRDKIMDLVEKLPGLLEETGNTIESAGESAVNASVFLTGGKDDTPSAGELSEMAAKALDSCYREIRSAARIMDHFGKELDDIRIPSLEPKYVEVMGMDVIGGLDFGESQLFDNAADRLKSGSDRLDEIGSDLRNVAKHLRNLGGALTDTGKDLNNVGVKLTQSGQTLRTLGNLNHGRQDQSSSSSGGVYLDI